MNEKNLTEIVLTLPPRGEIHSWAVYVSNTIQKFGSDYMQENHDSIRSEWREKYKEETGHSPRV